MIKKIKQGISSEELCKNLPNNFVLYFDYVRKLGFCERPDYSYLKSLFENKINDDIIRDEEYKEEFEPDWLYKLDKFKSSRLKKKENFEKFKRINSSKKSEKKIENPKSHNILQKYATNRNSLYLKVVSYRKSINFGNIVLNSIFFINNIILDTYISDNNKETSKLNEVEGFISLGEDISNQKRK